MSGLLVALTIGFVPILLVYLKKTVLRKNHLLLTLVIISPLILYPAKVLNSFNNENLGFDSHDLYTKPNYNQQSLLWGEHFVESTRGKMLVLSAIGSPGYALSMKPIIHSTRDFCLQFQSFIDWIAANKINAHALICGIMGVTTLIPIILLIKRNKKCFSNLSLSIFIIFYLIPFLGLAIVSNLHGFNYSLYSTHTIEYFLILLLPIIILWESSNLTKFFNKAFIMLILVLPLCNIIKLLPRHTEEQFISSTEKERGLSSSRFSKAIEYIENDSYSELDIIYFLPIGDMSDLVFRTKMRTMATHFAGRNFPQSPNCKSSKELNIYLAYDKELAKIPEFIQATRDKLQNTIQIKKVLKDGIFVHKIKFRPTLSVT